MSEPSGLVKLRAMLKSLPIGESVEDKLARIASGLASQIYTRDPETGELYLKGIQSLKDDWAGTPASQRKKGEPGIINETLSLPALAAIIPGGEKYVPDWALDAANNADAEHQAVRKEMNLSESKGFGQNAAEAAGVMLGQLPLPLARLRALQAAKSVPTSVAKKILGSAPEWFSPTVEPSVANYASGAGFGGAMGAYTDHVQQEAEDKADMSDAVDRLMRMKQKYGSFLPDQDISENPIASGQYAEGGKVGALNRALKMVSTDPKARVGFRPPVDDPLADLKERVRSLPSDEAQHHLNWIESTQGLPELTEEDIDRLLQLHDRIMKPVTVPQE